MRLLLLISLLGVAFASPIVKRTKEILMFGNQQNGPKVIKKSDPNVAALPDLQGEVRALDAEDLPSKNTDDANTVIEHKDDTKSIEKELIDQVMTEQTENTENNENTESESKDSGNNSGEQNSEAEQDEEENFEDDAKFSETAMTEISPDQENSIQELEKVDESAEENESDSKETENKDTSADSDTNTEEGQFGNPNDWIQGPYDLYKDYENNLYSNYPEQILNYYDLLGRNRRMAKTRAPNPFDIAVKRSRRIKRDIKDDILYSPYYLGDSQYQVNPYDVDFESPYVNEPSDSDIEAYLELLEEANKADPRLVEPEEYIPSYNMAKRVMYDGEPGYFVPVKRQGLMYEDKRNQYFFPFSEEPQTHYSAFVPEKRDYADTYERLLRLARALGKDDYGYEWQKKK